MIKILKIAFGATAAILIAQYLGLQNYVSAGIITILTVQDTVKETIKVSVKRVIAFLAASFLAYVLFTSLGHNIPAFGVFLLIFLFLCAKLSAWDAAAMCCVLTTHYLLAQEITVKLFVNEAALLLIGAGAGTLLNLYIPGNVKRIRQVQGILEEDLKTILFRMSKYIVREDKSDYTGKCFDEIDKHIENGIALAYANMNNTFVQETRYFMDYMNMRRQQTAVLREIYEKIIQMRLVPPHARVIADFLEHISDTFAESNNAAALGEECARLCDSFKSQELPKTREEFESRALLYTILLDLKAFIAIKGRFAASLTEKQIDLYWE